MATNSSTSDLNANPFRIPPVIENTDTENSFITVENSSKNASSSINEISNNYNDPGGPSIEIRECNNYIIEKSEIYLTYHCLGGGSYGKVIRAFYGVNEIAVKILMPKDNKIDELNRKLQNEVNILLSTIQSPNCIKFYGYNFDPPFIVTEYCPNGSLFKLIEFARSFPKSKATKELKSWERRLSMALKIADGMCYLHNDPNVIIHGDLKSPNILIDKDGQARIADFGLSCFEKDECNYKNNNLSSAQMNPLWSAPELLSDSKLTKKCDVFSFGIILWELLTFKKPYELENYNNHELMILTFNITVNEKRPRISNDRKSFPGLWNPKLEDYIKLIEDCWKTNPDERSEFKDIKNRLSGIKDGIYPGYNEKVISMNAVDNIYDIIAHMNEHDDNKEVKERFKFRSSKYFKFLAVIFYILASLCIISAIIVPTVLLIKSNEGDGRETSIVYEPEINYILIEETDGSMSLEAIPIMSPVEEPSMPPAEISSMPPEAIPSIPLAEESSMPPAEEPGMPPAEEPSIPPLEAPESSISEIESESEDYAYKSNYFIISIVLAIFILVTIIISLIIYRCRHIHRYRIRPCMSKPAGFRLSFYISRSSDRIFSLPKPTYKMSKKQIICAIGMKVTHVMRPKRLFRRKTEKQQIGSPYTSPEHDANLHGIEDIKAISEYYDLQLLDYEKPTQDKWSELRKLIMNYSETNELHNNEQFKDIYNILLKNETPLSKEEWVDFISLLLRNKEIINLEIWDKVKHFFIYS